MMEAGLKPSEILERAGDLLAKPGAWTQGEYARDRYGNMVVSIGESAVCWCSFGALLKIEASAAAASWLRKTTPNGDVLEWNDAPGRTQAEVVAAFRKAAALAREAGE